MQVKGAGLQVHSFHLSSFHWHVCNSNYTWTRDSRVLKILTIVVVWWQFVGVSEGVSKMTCLQCLASSVKNFLYHIRSWFSKGKRNFLVSAATVLIWKFNLLSSYICLPSVILIPVLIMNLIPVLHYLAMKQIFSKNYPNLTSLTQTHKASPWNLYIMPVSVYMYINNDPTWYVDTLIPINWIFIF